MDSLNKNIPTDTKIAFAFYELGVQYEKRNRIDLAIDNLRKSVSYDSDLEFVKQHLRLLIEKSALLKQKFISVLGNVA